MLKGKWEVYKAEERPIASTFRSSLLGGSWKEETGMMYTLKSMENKRHMLVVNEEDYTKMKNMGLIEGEPQPSSWFHRLIVGSIFLLAAGYGALAWMIY